jgi:ATP-dependent Clp protease ATP-binding subunit ClpC
MVGVDSCAGDDAKTDAVTLERIAAPLTACAGPAHISDPIMQDFLVPTNPTDVPLSAGVAQLIVDANDESAHRQHEYIGTEHLLLALSRPAANKSLWLDLGVEPQRVYDLISDTIQRGGAQPDIQRPFTSRTKRVFELAAASVREIGHSQIDVPHVLVGMMRERLSIGAQVLADQGLTVERAREYAQQSARP